MCLGDPYRPEPRLCTIAMLETFIKTPEKGPEIPEGYYWPVWYLIRWKVVDDVMYGKPKLIPLK